MQTWYELINRTEQRADLTNANSGQECRPAPVFLNIFTFLTSFPFIVPVVNKPGISALYGTPLSYNSYHCTSWVSNCFKQSIAFLHFGDATLVPQNFVICVCLLVFHVFFVFFLFCGSERKLLVGNIKVKELL